jgi:hypothetical protein
VVRYGDVTTLTQSAATGAKNDKGSGAKTRNRVTDYAACGLTLTADTPIAGLVPCDARCRGRRVRGLHDGELVPAPEASDDVWYVSEERDARGRPGSWP